MVQGVVVVHRRHAVWQCYAAEVPDGVVLIDCLLVVDVVDRREAVERIGGVGDRGASGGRRGDRLQVALVPFGSPTHRQPRVPSSASITAIAERSSRGGFAG